tara:strand:+ start:535 stop:837 length:303 start_codon:yes stop_codon:yes gene_type:complete
MDFFQILEQYGIPIAVAIAFGFFIWKQNKYIQDDLSSDLKNKHDRLEGILIKLIDQQKIMQIEQKGLERSYKTLVEIIAKLSGNGLKHKFMNMLNNKNED